jgi:type VI secretion system secreted protein VgrG
MDRDPINLIKIIEAPGGDDDLFLLRVDMSEGLSQLFRYKLTLSAHRGRPKQIDWLGQSVTFTIGTDPATAFKVNGQVSSFEIHRLASNFTEFSIDLVPSLWTARLSQNSRIFQEMDVRAIIAAVLKDYPDVKFEDKCKSSYPKREYCLQYRETDFDFISRLMEEEGIFYYFRFGKAGRYQHILYLGDDTSAYFEGMPKKLQYRSVETADNIHDMSVATQAIVGKRTTRAYDYLEPPKKLQAEVPSKLNWADKRTESYDYPLIYKDVGEGNRQAKMFMERHEAWSAVVQGASTYLSLVPGGRHDVSDEQQLPPHKKIVMIAVSQSIHDSENANTGASYHVGSFTAIPSDVTFRPQRSTPRPLIPGTQRAVVVGPPGEEIYTDEHGRIKVQFMWDREGKKDAKSSCWIRYMQQWAGPGYGAQWIPRIGMEVLVSFLEGDPDQPVVIGCLYNGDNKVPYELEGRKTQSGWRTVSSKGKGKRQEFIFEDKAGSEEVYLYGQRNHRVVFDEDESIKIGRNQANQIGANQSTEVGGNRDIKVQGNQKTAVTGSTDLESLSDVRWSAAGGSVKYSMSSGMFNLEAATSITLKAGASSISIGPAGISIIGAPMVLINSGGGGGSASAAQKAKVQAVLDKLADRKMKGGEGGWTDPRKLGTLAGNTSKKGGANAGAGGGGGGASPAPAAAQLSSMNEAAPPASVPNASLTPAQKLARRKERQALVAKGNALGASPAAKAAADRFSKNMDAAEKAFLSQHVYDPSKPPPVGWKNLSDDPAALSKLGLKPEMLEKPPSNFRAQVYQPDPTIFGPDAKPVVAFKGTSTGEDWKNNFQQGLNFESDYYRNAVKIGSQLKKSGSSVEMTGHSLGGGLASAAGSAANAPGTTFNAAGLHAATVGRYGGTASTPPFNAYQVDGEVLTGIQEQGVGGTALAGLAGGAIGGPLGALIGMGAKGAISALMPDAVGKRHALPATSPDPVRRHFMADVISGIEGQKAADQATLAGL